MIKTSSTTLSNLYTDEIIRAMTSEQRQREHKKAWECLRIYSEKDLQIKLLAVDFLRKWLFLQFWRNQYGYLGIPALV